MRAKKYNIVPQKNKLDIPLLINVLALVIFGLIIVYDASIAHAVQDFGDGYYYIKQQMIWVILGCFGCFFFMNFDYHNFKKLSPWGFFGTLALLFAVFIPGLGSTAGGAHRWLAIGSFNLQPAELFKLASVIYLAHIFEKGVRFRPFLMVVGLGGVILGLLQRDLGSAIVFCATSLVMYMISGGPIWQLSIILPIVTIAGMILTFTSDYRKKRVLAFLDPFSDTQGFTYHISQVLVALGSGGFLGLGLGQSRQKFYIPEVTTDSIFAIIGEEMGFFGAIFLIALFSFLIIRGLNIAKNSSDNFGRLLAGGITCWLGIQAVVNLGSMVALFPLTGVPLPFISYGGSALLTNLAAVGILLNVSKNS
jgi:cell division protein FtsW